MNDNEKPLPFIWEGIKPKRKQRLRVIPGSREDWSPAMIVCKGKCSDQGDFWEMHEMINGMYECTKCGTRRHWGTPQYRRW